MTEGADILGRDFGLVTDLIRTHAALRPSSIALIEEERRLTYGELDALMDRVAAALQRDDAQPRQAIAICSANSIEYAVVFLGALRAGVAVAPLSPSSTAVTLARMAADAQASHLFLDVAAADALSPVLESIDARCVALAAAGAGIPLARWLVEPGTRPTPVAIQPDWPFNIIYSSGTTGTPKGIVQPHAMRWAHVQRGPVYGYAPDAVTLLSTPLYSNTTLVSFFPTLAMGGAVVLMAKFDAQRYLEQAQQHGVTHTMLVPVQYQRLMARSDFDRYDLSSYRMKLSTSAPFAAALKADVLRRWPGALVEFYGMTEGGGTCVLFARDHPDKLHTVGLPSPGHDIRLIDDQGREVAAGQAGEVVGHSTGMMTGYHRQPGKTAEAEWFDATGKRFIRTGDIGRFDADGFLILLDRKKDLIISGGFNVYPSDLETVLRGHSDVADVAVVGVPSERWGETPVAYVVLRANASANGEELLQWTNARVGKLERLAAVELVGTLPRSPIGKVLKRELRDRYPARAAEH
jgi:acyl-CoA synthetase (AMP-forming)/AMP-acid ligase II